MAKKDVLLPAAERMYVQENYTLDAIAKELNIAERTVRYWKKDNSWANKRKEMLFSRTEFHQDLYLLAQKITKLVMLSTDRQLLCDELGDDEELKKYSKRVTSLTKLLSQLPKTKQYENSMNIETENKKDVSGEDIVNRMREIMNG